MSAHFLNVIWIALMVATVLTWFIGESGQMTAGTVDRHPRHRRRQGLADHL